MKLLFPLTLFFIFCNSINATELPTEHRWSASEKAILKTLWLGNLKFQVDKSNRVVDEPTAVELGHKLFFDKRFSLNGKVACASCHKPEKYFTDGLDTSEGIKKVSRNAPTIVGSSHNTWFFHDGRSDSLWSQALGPFENELEHGGNRSFYVNIVYNDPVLRDLYEQLFGKMPELSNKKYFPINAGPVKDINVSKAWKNMRKKDKEIVTNIFVNLAKSIAAYESKLQPAESRFDHYVKALIDKKSNVMQSQLSNDEVKGLRIFVSKAKCTICHSGPLLTDNGFHNISVPPRKDKANNKLKHDWGRYKGAQQVLKSPFNCRSEYNDTVKTPQSESCDELEYMVMDRHKTQGAMKTPSLRNVAKTAPYMHAGQLKTLREVINNYDNPPPVTFRQSELFLNFDLNDIEVDQLIAFLKALNSPINAPAHLLKAP